MAICLFLKHLAENSKPLRVASCRSKAAIRTMVNVFGLLLGSQAGGNSQGVNVCHLHNKSLGIVVSCQQVVFVANGMATEQAQSSALFVRCVGIIFSLHAIVNI